MNSEEIIKWLLQGDVSIQYLVHRDLLGDTRPELQARIATEGWGAKIMQLQKPDGHWGLGFYQPKWTSTHYTLLELKNLCYPSNSPEIRRSIANILKESKGADGGINPAFTVSQSDVCINGMFLNYASYFGTDAGGLRSVVDFILSQKMGDGGFNCRSNRSGARHSSLHTTLSVLEGIYEYEKNGYSYRLADLNAVRQSSMEFLLEHKLYQSSTTGEVIDKRMLSLSYPSRWRFDILRALEYFHTARVAYDERMLDALNIIIAKRRSDGTWPQQAKHSGQTHFDMETAGKPGRWNTLRALKVLKHYNRIRP
jgi:hypothetical protein